MSRALLITLAALLAAGCASTRTEPAAAAKTAAQPPASNCVATASRIPQNNCSGPGRTYSQEDLERTGQVNPGAALQMLDPSISGH
ncbi:MAG: hypothetical protein JOZ67_05145 [Gammaproteobacteria bacterium]|nr:hypothetical protein [Gammaproteobacteria bacterium]